MVHMLNSGERKKPTTALLGIKKKKEKKEKSLKVSLFWEPEALDTMSGTAL